MAEHQGQGVITDLYSKLTDIKDKIKERGITQTLFDSLTAQAKVIQDKLNELLAKQGVLSQSDISSGYETLQSVQRREMQQMSNKARNRAILFSVLIVGGVLGAYFLLKRKK